MTAMIRMAMALVMALTVAFAYAPAAEAAQAHAHHTAQSPAPCEHPAAPQQDQAPAPCDNCDAPACCHAPTLNFDMGAVEGFSADFAADSAEPQSRYLPLLSSHIDRPPRS